MNIGVVGEGRRTMNEEALKRAYEIIKFRAEHYENNTKTPMDIAFATAYKSAQCIFRAGIDGDFEVLNQYDDYKE